MDILFVIYGFGSSQRYQFIAEVTTMMAKVSQFQAVLMANVSRRFKSSRCCNAAARLSSTMRNVSNNLEIYDSIANHTG